MKKKFFIGLFIAAALGFLVFACILLKKDMQKESDSPALSAPIEIPETGIKQINGDFKAEKPAVIMFYVDWCTYCRRFMPIFGKVAAKYNKDFDFTVVNCENPENEKIVKEHDIAGFPSVFINDKDLDFEYQVSTSATVNPEEFEKELKKHLKLRSKLNN